MAIRERVGEDRFLDVNFRTLLNNPVEAVNNITSHFGLTPVDEGKMDEYLKRDRPDNRGKHTYTADHYGLNTEEVKLRFKNYIDRFNISLT